MAGAGNPPGRIGLQQASQLLTAWGRPPAHLALVSRLDCEIYRVRARRGGPDLALRVYPAGRTDPSPMQAEASWLHALADAGLHVPRPCATLDGGWLATGRDSADAPRLALLLHWLPGRTLYAGLRPVHLLRCGELVARMHEVGARMLAQGLLPPLQRAGGTDLAGWAAGRWSQAAALPARLRRLSQALAQQRLAERAAEGDFEQHGWIHGDLHLWNLVFHRGRGGAIDFSDCGRGLLLQDLAAVLAYLQHALPLAHAPAVPYPALRDALLEGYARVRPLPPSTAAQLPGLIAERRLCTLQWIADDWPRPDLRPWGPLLLRDCVRDFTRRLGGVGDDAASMHG